MANILENVGERTIEHLDYVGSLNIQWWATVRAMAQALPFVGNRYRWKAAVRQMLEIGVDAIPMVSLMAVCTGFIFAMQGASELRRFGALRYVVDLVAVGFTRELGPLMTAIAVSGRSGSAFAAEIGTMKVTEELDSLRVMALEPLEFVLAPKYLAALISVPCLSVASNLCGILAGGCVTERIRRATKRQAKCCDDRQARHSTCSIHSILLAQTPSLFVYVWCTLERCCRV